MPDGVLKYDDRPFSSSKTSNWVARKGGLPPYVRAVARALMRDKGMSESHAIAVGINAVKRWSGSGRVKGGGANRAGGGGGQVKPQTRAKASAAVARWTAMKKDISAGVTQHLVDRDTDQNWDYLAKQLSDLMTEGGWPWPKNLS